MGGRGHGEKRSRKEDQAILALLHQPTVEAAAKACGIGESTLWRWMQQPAFQERYRAVRRQVVETAIGQLQQATGEAVETLRRNLNCGNESVEVRAAVAILEHAVGAVELLDLAARVEALEEAVAQRGLRRVTTANG